MDFTVLKRKCRRCGNETDQGRCPNCWCYATPVLVGTTTDTRQVSLQTAVPDGQSRLSDHIG